MKRSQDQGPEGCYSIVCNFSNFSFRRSQTSGLLCRSWNNTFIQDCMFRAAFSSKTLSCQNGAKPLWFAILLWGWNKILTLLNVDKKNYNSLNVRGTLSRTDILITTKNGSWGWLFNFYRILRLWTWCVGFTGNLRGLCISQMEPVSHCRAVPKLHRCLSSPDPLPCCLGET